MGRYRKLWGNLLGAAVGLGVGYGLLPDTTGEQVMTAWNTLIPLFGPLIGGAIGTYFPRNDP